MVFYFTSILSINLVFPTYTAVEIKKDVFFLISDNSSRVSGLAILT